MKIVIAPDSFKHSLPAKKVIHFLSAGLKRARPGCDIIASPMADGGEGTAAALAEALDGRMRSAVVTGPLGKPVRAQYALLPDGSVALDMAEASGLMRLRETERDPLRTTTFGTGELIRLAIRRGVRRVIVGAGGSATVDGGAGALQALGARCLDRAGRVIEEPLSGGSLKRVARVDLSQLRASLANVSIIVAVDVTNPLLGRLGAAPVYAPQKGAAPKDVTTLAANLRRWSAVLKKAKGSAPVKPPGTGAAGGLAFGLAVGAGATLELGAPLVARLTNLEGKIRRCDAVVTGEGEVNHQTFYGKTPLEVLRLAAAHRKPCFVLCGRVGPGADLIMQIFPNAVLWPIADGPRSLEESLRDAPQLMQAAGERLGSTLSMLF